MTQERLQTTTAIDLIFFLILIFLFIGFLGFISEHRLHFESIDNKSSERHRSKPLLPHPETDFEWARTSRRVETSPLS